MFGVRRPGGFSKLGDKKNVATAVIFDEEFGLPRTHVAHNNIYKQLSIIHVTMHQLAVEVSIYNNKFVKFYNNRCNAHVGIYLQGNKTVIII